MLKKFLNVMCIVGLLISVFPALLNAQGMTLTVWDWHAPRMEVLKPKLDEYSKLYPEIEFKTMIVSGDEYWKKLLAGIMAGQAPADIIEFHNAQTTRFVEFLEPLPESIFPLDEMREVYYNFDQGFVLWDGKSYFLPGGLMAPIVYYNVDMWKESGLDVTPKTWEEFRQVAKKLTRYDGKGNVQIAGTTFGSYLPLIWEDMKYQLGGWMYTEDGKAADPSWVEEPGIKSLTFLRDLMFEDKVTEPGFLDFTEAFGTQRAAMIYGWAWVTGFLNFNYPELKYAVFTLPTWTGEMTPAVSRNNYECDYAVLKTVPEEKKEEAFKFLKWLYTQDDFLVKLNQEMGRVPATKSLWEDPEIKLDPTIGALTEQIPYTIFPGERPEFIDTAGNNFMVRVERGESVEDCLKAYKEEVDGYLKERPVIWNVERMYKPPEQ